MVLNSSQRNALFNRIPNILGGQTAYKYRRDQGTISPEMLAVSYPSVTFSVLTHSSRMGHRTFGRYIVWRDLSNDVQDEFGEINRATISITLSMQSVDDSDYYAQIARDQVLDMAQDLEQQLKFFRIGLDWSRDRIKFVEVVSSVELPPERVVSTVPNRYIYRSVVDFIIDYELKVLDPADNIRTIMLDGHVSVDDPETWFDELPRFQPGCFGMYCTVGTAKIPRKLWVLDALLLDTVEESTGMSVMLV